MRRDLLPECYSGNLKNTLFILNQSCFARFVGLVKEAITNYGRELGLTVAGARTRLAISL